MARHRSVAARSASSGFSLLEVMVALSILSIISIGLLGLITSSQQLTNTTRERTVAMNAIRTYVEKMRSLGRIDAIMADRTTPADYLPTSRTLKNARGTVLKLNRENGGQCVKLQGLAGATNTTTTVSFVAWSPGSTFLHDALQGDATALGFTSGVLDLDGDGATTTNPVPDASLIRLPVKVSLSWTTGAGFSTKAGASNTQTVVVHVCF